MLFSSVTSIIIVIFVHTIDIVQRNVKVCHCGKFLVSSDRGTVREWWYVSVP